MLGVERCCELAEKDVSSLQQVATPYIDDHLIPPEDFETMGELPTVLAQIVLTSLNLARMGRPDLLSSVNTPAKSGTNGVTLALRDCHV